PPPPPPAPPAPPPPPPAPDENMGIVFPDTTGVPLRAQAAGWQRAIHEVCLYYVFASGWKIRHG
ncbi:MAG: hypothetical protein LBK99_26210, partial [Opitutaceae bacterium]|nr:hypothetical protein [Opitutaceae bacterium]